MPHRLLPLAALTLLACVMAWLAPAPSPANAQEATPPPPPNTGLNFFGINFIAPYQPWLALGYNSGARVVRWQFNWRDIETTSGNFGWEQTDAQVAAWNRAGLEINAILHNPPDFMIDHGLVPKNLNAPYTSGDSSFARYCNRFAERYRGRIASYEVWNEPDLTQYWGGSAEEYVALLKGCYRGIKAADPAVTVVMAGMAYTTNRAFTAAAIRLLAQDPDGPANHNFFDVMAIHMYSDPDNVYKHTVAVRNTLINNGLGGKPIWITETNVPLRGVNGVPDDPIPGMGTPEEGGWYVLQAASNALAAGAQKLMFFRLADDDMQGEAWGLVNNQGTPRPGYKALQLASSVFKEVTTASRETRDGVVIIVMRRLDGGRVVAVYSPDGKAAPVAIPAEFGAATLINAAGGYTPIEAEADGAYHVTVPPATGRDPERPWDYQVGGPVLILVEYDREPPAATVEVVPLPEDPQHVLVKWRGDDGRFGTGIAQYDVQFNNNGLGWEKWMKDTTETQAIFDISTGGEFGFRARATDKVGNVGEFSTPTSATLRIIGTLLAHVVDLRGQDVPGARITLADGSLHDTDASGWVRIDIPPGSVQIASVDGGKQGIAGPQPALEVALAEEQTQLVRLEPRNLIANGGFDAGLDGWAVSDPADALRMVVNADVGQAVLRIAGQRRVWGSPAAEIEIAVPADYTDAALGFQYHLSESGQWLIARIVTGDSQQVVWQQSTPNPAFAREWFAVSQFAGQTIRLRFELYGPKGGPPAFAEIDDVVFGNVPVLSP